MTLLETFMQFINPPLNPVQELHKRRYVLADRIANHERQMMFAEMSDDRYYSNGRRQRDLEELAKMKAELSRLAVT